MPFSDGCKFSISMGDTKKLGQWGLVLKLRVVLWKLLKNIWVLKSVAEMFVEISVTATAPQNAVRSNPWAVVVVVSTVVVGYKWLHITLWSSQQSSNIIQEASQKQSRLNSSCELSGWFLHF